jgi:predicted AlkP superfamily pyrophosphatase or phosphodiesterase
LIFSKIKITKLNKKIFFPFLVLLLILPFLFSGTSTSPVEKKQPKLVIGIVVDQMAYDFIPRYLEKYSGGGFRRLISGGFFCRNTKLVHFPSYTAVGHSGIYTGSVPSLDGIAGNDWYDRSKDKLIYCADDDTCRTIGSDTRAGRMSPSNLLVSTITDELVKSDIRSKVIGIALKDRGAIFPAGHYPAAAYWYDASAKKWITSSYYMNKLPEWVNKFNDKSLPDYYLSQDWNTLLPIEQYTESTEDDSPFEDKFKGEEKPVFPHKLGVLAEKNLQLMRTCPAGNTLTKDFAIDAIANENLGRSESTDFLCISFSSTDYVGHKFGPNSIETEDTYLRVDRDIAVLLNYIDSTVGKENYLLFLTADHGVCENPGYLKSKGVQAGTFFTKAILDSVNANLEKKFECKNLALYFFNQQVFLNRKSIEKNNLVLDEVIKFTEDYILENVEGVENVCTKYDLMNGKSDDYYFSFFKNGFCEKRCGEIFVNFKKYWIEDRVKGAEHGGPYEYDIHIPLIWYGCEIPKGETSEPVYMTDIAPTLSKLLNIGIPGGCIGKPIKEITGN